MNVGAMNDANLKLLHEQKRQDLQRALRSQPGAKLLITGLQTEVKELEAELRRRGSFWR